MTHLSVFNSTSMALLKEDGTIWAYENRDWHARDAPKGTTAVAVAIGPGGLWCLGADKYVYRWNAGAWTNDFGASAVTTLSCDAHGNFWCVNTDGGIFVWYIDDNPGMKTLTKVADAPISGHVPTVTTHVDGFQPSATSNWKHQVVANDTLFQLGRDYYHTRDFQVLQRIADKIADLSGIPRTQENTLPLDTILTMPPTTYR